MSLRMNHKLIGSLAFLVFQITTATLFLRPAEIFEPLEEMPVYEGLMITCILLAANTMQWHFRPYAIIRQPISLCTLGLVFAIGMSHASHFYLSGIIDSLSYFLKTFIYYALLITIVNTPTRLKAFLANIAFCCSLMVTLCVIDFYGIMDFVFIEPLIDFYEIKGEDIPGTILRMRGTGLFHDPNDLAMVIVFASVWAGCLLTDVRSGMLRLFWILPLIMNAIAMISTKSRGGLLAGAAAFMVMLAARFGGKMAVFMGVLGLMALPFMASRQTEIDLSDGTGQERIQIWRDGFDALKSPDLLFGTGEGTYPEIAGFVAHNSFIHAYVELGLVGGTLFFGMFFYAGFQLYRIQRGVDVMWHQDLHHLHPFIAAALGGWAVSLLSLSRCYIVPTYVMIGVMAAYINLCWIHTQWRQPVVIWKGWEFGRLALASGLVFCMFFAFTVIMAR